MTTKEFLDYIKSQDGFPAPMNVKVTLEVDPVEFCFQAHPDDWDMMINGVPAQHEQLQIMLLHALLTQHLKPGLVCSHTTFTDIEVVE